MLNSDYFTSASNFLRSFILSLKLIMKMNHEKMFHVSNEIDFCSESFFYSKLIWNEMRKKLQINPFSTN